MAQFLLCENFYSELPVVVLGHECGNDALGFWLRLGSYHAQWHTYDVPVGATRLCGGNRKEANALLAHGFLVTTDNPKYWKLGYENVLWSLLHSRSGYRTAIPAAVRAQVMERDEHTCQFCSATENLTLDHIIPWSHGGPDTVENLRVLCRRCNSARGNRVEVDA